MSKLIVEMEMPTRCGACKCRHVEFDIDRVAVFCEIKDNEYVEDPDSRPSWCPIIGELPDEHGDLVDKETAKNAFDSSFLTFRMKDGETMRGFYQRTIDELPVLIKAERKDDGTTAD